MCTLLSFEFNNGDTLKKEGEVGTGKERERVREREREGQGRRGREREGESERERELKGESDWCDRTLPTLAHSALCLMALHVHCLHFDLWLLLVLVINPNIPSFTYTATPTATPTPTPTNLSLVLMITSYLPCTQKGWNALHHAAAGGHEEVVRWLMERRESCGLDLEARSEVR